MLIDLCLHPRDIEALDLYLKGERSKPKLTFVVKSLLSTEKEKRFEYLDYYFSEVKLEYTGDYKGKLYYLATSYNVSKPVKANILDETANTLSSYFTVRKSMPIGQD